MNHTPTPAVGGGHRSAPRLALSRRLLAVVFAIQAYVLSIGKAAALLGLAMVMAAGMPVASARGGCTSSWDQCDECDLHNCHLRCCYDPPELWVVNTRCVSRCNNLDAEFERISYKRYDRETRCFITESRESFLAQEATMPTLFFAHGNSLKHPQAMEQCWDMYRRMRCCPGQKRMVFWSWPAEVVYKRPILRPREVILKNLRIKLVYSEYQGYYMAKLVRMMSFTQRITVGGHSYGGIHGAVAAHYLGGGMLRGLVLEGGAPVQWNNLRVAVVSGAFDNDAMYPGCRYGQAFVAAEKVFNTRNPRDSTLRKWPDVSLRGRQAMGVTGINPARLGQYQPKLCQVTMTGEVGKSHYIAPHLDSDKFVAALCCFAFPECTECVRAMQEGRPWPQGPEVIDDPAPPAIDTVLPDEAAVDSIPEDELVEVLGG